MNGIVEHLSDVLRQQQWRDFQYLLHDQLAARCENGALMMMVNLRDDGVGAEGNDVKLQRPFSATSFFHRCFEFWTC